MTWARVDDHLHSHRKAMRAGTEAMGLWVLALSWASAEESDGWVPSYVLTRLVGADRDETLATLLVLAGLWHEGEHDGEHGYRFHQWEEHQPTKAQLEERRRQGRERMARARAQNPHNESTAPAVTTTRPDPTRPEQAEPVEGAKRARQVPEDFRPNEKHLALAEELSVDLRAEWPQFIDHHRSRGSTMKDWDAALRTWIRNANRFGNRGAAPAPTTRPAMTLNQCSGADCPGVRHEWNDAANRFLCVGNAA